MDTQTLLRLAHSDYKIKRTFGGVLASDMLPEKRGHYRSFIVNTYSSMSTVLKGASKKRKTDISEKEKNSVKHKTINKRLSRFESESDVDVVLLAEVFENFRTLSMNYFELDSVHISITTPSLTWSAGINTTNVTLELLTDINMYLMLESGIRGGMCPVSKRYSKANNKYLDNFDEMSPSKFIISLDVNSLYGTSMAFYNLLESEFRFLNEEEIDKFNLMSVYSDSNIGYILEVDLFYPPELHSKHNSFPHGSST
ncbi:uncharacterized protein TNIN_320981 [Trichonephila inaurata madagascariensis]|uniref:DNA-directed DNA polymerase n=1 Tax=Trichonephila inaurata madagascariensis TaxID=2747483 RepID=A0A8X6Y2H3_9ARAC|nr:uncharacterized protein TNIN_320981 [Trichonephila inaurata madagascariensis]